MAQYNAPWVIPPFRKNEILIPIKKNKSKKTDECIIRDTESVKKPQQTKSSLRLLSSGTDGT